MSHVYKMLAVLWRIRELWSQSSHSICTKTCHFLAFNQFLHPLWPPPRIVYFKHENAYACGAGGVESPLVNITPSS